MNEKASSGHQETRVQSSSQSVDLTPADFSTPHSTARYDLLEEIGRGGMGVVYTAYDRQLDREVAIKVLADVPANDSTAGRHRFIREAIITSQLQHPGIPPIHELGELPDGRPYLAMKLIRGTTLRELLAQRSDPSEDLGHYIAVFEQICHAVGYAHAHGVIHRDLKPRNIMVGAHGEVQVMDWGLAKRLETEAEAEHDLERPQSDFGASEVTSSEGTPVAVDSVTRTGQVMGSPAYMPPEQAGGRLDQIDTRCDVFGLGAILCVILTGQPPYVGKDGRNVLTQARVGDLGETFQRLKPCNADPDLVSLCVACLSPDRGDRPADANKVAEVVTRIRDEMQERAKIAETERVKAVISAMEQRKRRRQLLVSATAIITVLSLGVIGTSVSMVRAQQNRRAAERARERAIAAERRAIAERDAKAVALGVERETRQQAMEALRFMTDRLIERELAGRTYLSQSNRRFLQAVIERFEGLANLRGDSPEAQAVRGEGYLRIAKMRRRLGEPLRAVETAAAAVDIYRGLAASYPERLEFQHELTRSLNELGTTTRIAHRRLDEALKFHQEALEISRRLVRRRPENPEYRRAVGVSLSSIGVCYFNMRRIPEGIQVTREAASLGEQLVEEFPSCEQYLRDLANRYNNLAAAHLAVGQYEAAIDMYRKAFDVDDRLVQQFPDRAAHWQGLAAHHANIAVTYRRIGRQAEAIEHNRKAQSLREQLVKKFPGVPEYRFELARSHSNLGVALDELGRHRESEQQYRSAIRILTELKEQFPGMAVYRRDLARSHTNLGIAHYRAARYEEAERQLTAAIQIAQDLAEASPQDVGYRETLAAAFMSLGNVYRAVGRQQEALKQYQSVCTIHEELVRRFPDIPTYRRELGKGHGGAAGIYLDMRRYEEAEEGLQRAILLLAQLVDDQSGGWECRRELAVARTNLGAVYHAVGRRDDAIAEYLRAINLQEQLLAEMHRSHDDTEQLARNHRTLGQLFVQSGKPESAMTHFRRAIEVWRLSDLEYPRNVLSCKLLAETCVQLALWQFRTRRYADATITCRRGIDELNGLVGRSPDDDFFVQTTGELHLFHGWSLMELGKYPEAVEPLRRAVVLFVRNLRADPVTNWDKRCRQLLWALDRLDAAERASSTEVLEATRSYYPAVLASLAELEPNVAQRPGPRAVRARLLISRGEAERRRGDLERASALAREAEADIDAAMEHTAILGQARATARARLGLLITVHAARFETEQALELAERVRNAGWNSKIDSYNAACYLARCLPILRGSGDRNAAQRQAALESFRDRAISWLKHARDQGLRDAHLFRTDPDLRPLADDPAFRKFLESLASESE